MGGAPVIVWLAPGIGFTEPAAASFLRLVARLGRVPDVNRTTSDYATQLAMYNAWSRYVASGYNASLKPNHSRALHPDKSVHVQGNAWDTDDWATPGFIALAAEYGWIRTAANDPTEQHHFEYQSWNDRHINEGVPQITLARGADGVYRFNQEDDMPTMGEIFHNKVVKGPDGNDISLAQHMQYSHVWAAQAVWRHLLAHGLSGKGVAAGDLLRFEPAEHENTRRMVAAVATGDIDYDRIAADIAEQYPKLDVNAIAVAAADEADRRERERLGKA